MKRFARRHGLDLLIVMAAVAAVAQVFARTDDAAHQTGLFEADS